MTQAPTFKDEWELSKENIQPLKQGRNFTALQNAMKPEHQNLISEQHCFEKRLRSYEGSDPLEIWYSYLKWTEQYFPSGKSIMVRQIAEKCIKALKDDVRYQNDIRWFEMFKKVMQNSTSISPSEFFQNMSNVGHCTKLSRFYIEWATAVEETEDFKKAADIYHTGLRERAEPLSELQEALGQFECRIAKKLAAHSPSFDDEEQEPTRNLFGVLKPVGAKSEAPFNRVSSGLSAFPGQQQQQLFMQRPAPASSGKPSFTVYGSSVPVPAQNSTAAPTTASLLACNTKVLNKENVVDPGKWSSNKVPYTMVGKSQPAIATKQPFKVFFDAESENAASKAPMKSVSVNSTLLSAKIPDPVGVLPMGPFSEQPPIRSSASTGSKNERFMWCQDKLQSGVQEMSFEEMRAIKYLNKNPFQTGLYKRTETSRKSPDNCIEMLSASDEVPSATKAVPGSAQLKERNNIERPALKPMMNTSLRSSKSDEFTNTSNPLVAINGTACRPPSPNGTLTTNVYKEAMAFFSNTLQFSGIAEDEKAPDCSLPLTNASASQTSAFALHQPPSLSKQPFKIFDGNAMAKEQPPKNISDDKENIAPAGYLQFKEPRLQLGHLPLIDVAQAAPSDSDTDQEQHIDRNQPVNVVAIGDSADTTQYEPTIARFMGPTIDSSARLASTPLHLGAGLRPPCFSSTKPGDVFMLSSAGVPDFDPIVDNVNDDKQLRGPSSEAIGPDVFVENAYKPSNVEDPALVENGIERRLSTIAETSREYRSASSSSGSEASSRRHFSTVQSTTTYSIKFPGWTPGGSNTSEWPSGHRSEKKERKDASGHFNINPTTPFQSCSKTSICEADEDLGRFASPLKTIPKNFHVIEDEDIEENVEKTGVGFVTHINGTLNPFDPDLQNRILLKASNCKRLDTYINFHHFASNMPAIRVGRDFELGGEVFKVKKFLGQGAFARAYCCEIKDDSVANCFAVKVQKPACPWEFYMCEQLQSRLKGTEYSQILSGVMSIKDAYMYSNGSIMVNDYHPFGTLLDLTNKCRTLGASLPEELVVYFTIQIIGIVEALHYAGIIHADIKPDNFLLVNLPDSISLERPENAVHCVKLIDFGRAIDMSHLPPNASFTGTVETSCFQCPEMLDGRKWNYQVDMFGILATIHVLIFGDYMKPYKSAGTWKATSSFKRRWNVELWKSFYYAMLNIPSCHELPDLASWRTTFETYFAHCVSNDWKLSVNSLYEAYKN